MNKSAKVSAISSVACVMVVLIHMVHRPYEFLAAMLTQWAVPWFMIVSGFFFVGTLQKYSLVVVLRKKVQSLLVPYLIFGGWAGVLHAFPLDNQPLWYVKSLMVFMLIWSASDYIFHRYRKAAVRLALSASCYCLCCYALLKMTCQLAMPASFVYFLIGVVLAHVDEGALSLKNRRKLILLLSMVGVLIAAILRLAFPEDPTIGVTAMNRIIRNFSNLSTVLLLWSFSDLLPRAVSSVNKTSLYKYSFFIYLVHYPLISSGIIFHGGTECLLIAVFKTMALVTIIVAIGYALRRVLPDFWNITIGGRA